MAGMIDFNLNFGSGGKDSEISFGSLMNAVRGLEDRSNRSLTQFVRKSMVASRVFIQKEVAEEEILPDLLLTLQQMYIGWIMTAMQLNRYVDQSRTVRTALDIVATEDMKHISTDDLLSGLSLYTGTQVKVKKECSAGGLENSNVKLAAADFGGSQMVDTHPKKDLNLPSGRIIEVKFNIGGDESKTLTVNLYVQLMPTFVPASVAGEFFRINFKPSLAQRWFQVTSGEKRFIADFLFELDLLKKRNAAVKDDKTGVLFEMMDRQKNGLFNYLKKLATDSNRQNIANTLHIYDKLSFDRWCSETNCNFKRFDHREKFFARTFSMVVAVVDTAYGRVDMYFHGIDNRGEYNFNQLHQQAKTEKYDLQSIMKAYYNSSAPKF